MDPPLSFEEIAGIIDEAYTGIFSKKLIKKRHKSGITHESNRNSRISALLAVNGQIYQTYALLDPCSSAWITEAEFSAANYINGCIQRESQYFSNRGILLDNKCILTFRDEIDAKKMILASSKGSIRIDPCRIYSTSYVMPSYRFLKWRLNLFGRTDWRSKITNVLFPGGIDDGIADKVTDDGKEIYNFIGCDLNWMRHVTPRISLIDNKIVILSEKWMVDALSKIYDKSNIEIIALSDNDIDVIAMSLQ